MSMSNWPKLKTFLIFLGLEPVFFLDPDPYFRKQDDRYWIMKMIFNWMYPLLIWCILWFRPVLLFLSARHLKRTDIIPDSIFNIIQPVQYYIAFWYFRGQHTKRIYESKTENKNVPEEERWKCLPGEETLVKLVMSVSMLIVLVTGINFIIYQIMDQDHFVYNLPNWMIISNFIFGPLSILYGRFIVVLNTAVFFFSFFQQMQKMQFLRRKLQKRYWHSMNQSSVATLCYEILDIRYTLSRMIDKLEYMYITTTIVGGIAIGVAIGYNIFDYQVILTAVIFLVMQFFFLLVIHNISSEREEILRIVRHRNFASKYILRRNDFCQACLEIQHVEDKEEHPYESMIQTSDSQSSYSPWYDDKSQKQTGFTQTVSDIMNYGTGSGIHSHSNNLNKYASQTDINIDTVIGREPIDEVNMKSYKSNMDTIDEILKSPCIPQPSCDLESVPLHEVVVENPPTNSFMFHKRTLGKENHENHHENTENELDSSKDFHHKMKKLLGSAHIDDPYRLSASGCVLSQSEFIRCIYEWVSNSGSSIDWLILNNLLNEQWASFGMFGVDFSDGSALKKALMVTTAVISAGSYLTTLEWFLNN